MKNILEDLEPLGKSKALEILTKVVSQSRSVQIKQLGEKKIINSQLEVNLIKNRFHLSTPAEFFSSNAEITIKIVMPLNLYFLKTTIKKTDVSFYFDNIEHFYELIRRRSLRFSIPDDWSQSAHLQSADPGNSLKAIAKIIEISKFGMKLKVSPEIPRYEKNQTIKVRFKIHRRGEVQILSRIIHLKRNNTGGPTLGVQFLDMSMAVKNRLTSIYDDLAFHYINLS